MARTTPEHTQARKRDIMNAAVRCFARHGFQGARVSHIAREAGLSTGAVYTYFRSKRQIIEALVDLSAKGLPREMEEAGKESTASAALRSVLSRSLVALTHQEAASRARLSLSVWVEEMHRPRAKRRFGASAQVLPQAVESTIRRGQQIGEFNETTDAAAAGHLVAAVLEGLVVQRALDPDTDVVRPWRLFERVLLHTLGVPVVAEEATPSDG